MTDIVTRLRKYAPPDIPEAEDAMLEAADEIERLRADLEDAHEIINAWQTKADQRADRIAEQQSEIERLRNSIGWDG